MYTLAVTACSVDFICFDPFCKFHNVALWDLHQLVVLLNSFITVIRLRAGRHWWCSLWLLPDVEC